MITPPLGGLSDAEASARLRREGPNELPTGLRRGLLAIAPGVARDPMFLLLLVSCTNLSVDESPLTGESVPVHKVAGIFLGLVLSVACVRGPLQIAPLRGRDLLVCLDAGIAAIAWVELLKGAHR